MPGKSNLPPATCITIGMPAPGIPSMPGSKQHCRPAYHACSIILPTYPPSTMISNPRPGLVAFVAALLLVTSALSHFSSPMLVDASSISSAANDFDDGVKVTYSAGGARIVERRLQSKYDELCSDCKLFTVTPTLEFILRAFKFVTDMEECLHVTIW